MFERLSRLLGRSTSSAGAGQAHLTFGNTSVGRAVTRTGLLLKKQLWVWPIVAVVLLAAVGFGIAQAIEYTMRRSLESQLLTLLNVERAMLETWLKIQTANGESLANDQQIREVVSQILEQTAPDESADPAVPDASAPAKSSAQLNALRAKLSQELSPGMSAHHFASYILADKDHKLVAASRPELLGQTVDAFDPVISRALEGHTTVSPPFASVVLLKDEKGRMRIGVPTMLVCAPVRDANFQVIGVLGLRIRPEREFTRILQLGQLGTSGETYAINKDGMMVSNSRFDEQLILSGLIPDTDDARSILNIAVRDPGGNLMDGFRPGVRRAELAMTKSAAAAVEGGSGIDLDGYRDYRGVRVVGAWQWLPEYGIGIITELDFAEAYRPLTILRRAFFAMFGLLALSSVAIFIFTLVVARLQREAQKAAIEAKHLGQYRLETKLGEGAMGVVYRGQHAMLRRPTAIKMLNVERVTEASMQRFEREVQITCKLNHPNTVAIYDFGRTPEGVFYYAMEYLDGIDLQALVDRYGPQPEGRVIRILKQICGSLYEAHLIGLVHRDIKPANIMLNRRGGESDVVKVLDFGLVKALDDKEQGRQQGGMSGTPLYMSPESIQTPDLVDPRSDIYAVGAVGYFLLTGKPVFQASSLAQLCQQHIAELPATPSQCLGRPISTELESAILACLEKSPAKRPQTARDLITLLDRAPTADDWTPDDADAWWGRHERQLNGSDAGASASVEISVVQQSGGAGMSAQPTSAPSTPPSSAATSTSGFDRTIAHDPDSDDQ